MKLEAYLEPATHTYHFKDLESGNEFVNDISITQIIKSMQLEDLSGIDQQVLKNASERGTHLHELTENALMKDNIQESYEYIENNLNPKYYEFEYGVKDIVNQIYNTGRKVLQSEMIIYFKTPNGTIVGGSIDLITLNKHLNTCEISDMKFRAEYKENPVAIQCNLYLYALKYMLEHDIEINGVKLDFVKDIKSLNCLHCNKNGFHEYMLPKYNNAEVEKSLIAFDKQEIYIPQVDINVLISKEDIEKLNQAQKQIKELEKYIKDTNEMIKKSMIENNYKTLEIGNYRYTVYESEGRTILDSAKVKEILGEEQYNSCLKKGKSSVGLRITEVDNTPKIKQK